MISLSQDKQLEALCALQSSHNDVLIKSPPEWLILCGLGTPDEILTCHTHWPSTKVCGIDLDLRVIEACRRRFRLPYVVFRPHNVYGERQNLADSARNVVGIFMNQILRGESMTVFGDGSQSRAFSYVGDVAPYLAAAPRVSVAIGQTFNVGSNDILSVNELARLVAEVMGRPSYPTVYLPARGEARSVRPSHARLCSVFGEGRQTSLRDGLTRMARWAAGVGGSEPKPLIPLEIARTIR